MSEQIERVLHDGNELAIILRAGYHNDGIQFFTAPEYSQQLAYMNRPAGHVIDPHVHNEVRREVVHTLEALFVRSGKVKLSLYDSGCEFVDSRVLEAGDIVLLTSGGHGIEMLEPSEIVEVKQGPYAGDQDKTRFDPSAQAHATGRGTGTPA